jgi:glucose/arabinose dehydrogenase
MNARLKLCLAIIFLLIHAAALHAQKISTWATGLNKPVGIVSAGDNRLFIVEQGGLIKIVNGQNHVLADPFLNVRNKIATGGERGLLNLAFHPNYANNGLFYIYYTNLNGNIDIAQYKVSSDPNIANPTGTVILSIPHPNFGNHNGGGMNFGPDGFLYLSLGDGGGGGDPSENAQNLGILLGKILRIDVNNAQAPKIVDFNEPGDIATWNIKKGDWTITGGSLNTTTNKKAEIISDLVGCRGTMEVDVNPQTIGTRISILACYQDNKNFIEIRMLQDKGRVILRQFSEGKKIADEKVDFPVTIQQSTHLRFTFDGSQYLLFVGSETNPLLRMAAQGSSGGGPGIRVKSTKGIAAEADIDNLRITSPYGIPATNPFVGSAGRDEIWAYGLRNPWRFTFDRKTGDLFIGDVGQKCFEEVNFEPASSPGGVNYGWDVVEGRKCYDEPSGGNCNLPSTCGIGNFKGPILVYGHDDAAICAVTGGYRYRGSAIPSLSGKYIFGDYCSGRVYVATESAGSWSFGKPLFNITSSSVTSFGEDDTGEIYFTDAASGIIYRITP